MKVKFDDLKSGIPQQPGFLPPHGVDSIWKSILMALESRMKEGSMRKQYHSDNSLLL